MLCKWEPFEDKYKCKNCGFVVKRNTIKKNCSAYKQHKVIDETEKQPPNIAKRAKNLGKATAKHVMTGMKYCTQEQKQKRFDICKSNKCGLFRGRGNGGICAHDDCGCPIRSQGKFIDKLSWRSSKCPKGLWGPENDDKTI